ncbi:MAG: leucine-rich repeat protein [Paludibacteraceae bacterium]|nr:leucine-rich repeat protein [Paludibacteraceae bacterium]
MKTKIFIFFFTLIAGTGTIFASTKIGNLYYNLDDEKKTAEVTSQNSSSPRWTTSITSANIPTSVEYNANTYSVTSIGTSAFNNCAGLTSVTIPNSVTSIGSYAFYYCTKLTSVTIPNSVTSIGNYTFCNCTKLTSVEIPNSVTSIGYSAFKSCTSLTSIEIPNSVTSIGSEAFYGCTGLTSPIYNINVFAYLPGSWSGAYTIPDSIESIAPRAFYDCSGLTSITIPSSVTSIGGGAFDKCTGLSAVHISDIAAWCAISFGDYSANPLSYAQNLYLNGELVTDLVIPNSVTSIGYRAFSGCSGLTSVTIGNSVTSIGDYAFYGCTGLTSVTIPNSVTSIGNNAFLGCSNLTAIHVPCGEKERFQTMLADNADIIYADVNNYTLITSGENGSIQRLDSGIACSNTYTLTAQPDYGYHFAQWSDGNKENPRTVILTQDTTFTAIFAIDKSGTCGENNVLKWEYEDQSKTLTISANGALTENYTFGIEASTQMRNLIIGNEVTSIGDSAFYGMNSINHLTIGSSVLTIGDYAFAECKNFDDITCYAGDVPTINATTFANIGNKQYIYLYVPEGRQRAYQRDTYWGEFDVQVKEAEAITQPVTEVSITPADNTATITWPTSEDANTYTLEISKDGVVFCTLIFNANGQLTGIAFAAPGKSGNRHAPAAVKTSNGGLRFTVTGLDSGTNYHLTLLAKDSGNQEIASYAADFTTTGTATAIDNTPFPSGEGRGEASKILLDGQLLILRGNHIYDAQGKLIK